MSDKIFNLIIGLNSDNITKLYLSNDEYNLMNILEFYKKIHFIIHQYNKKDFEIVYNDNIIDINDNRFIKEIFDDNSNINIIFIQTNTIKSIMKKLKLIKSYISSLSDNNLFMNN